MNMALEAYLGGYMEKIAKSDEDLRDLTDAERKQIAEAKKVWSMGQDFQEEPAMTAHAFSPHKRALIASLLLGPFGAVLGGMAGAKIGGSIGKPASSVVGGSIGALAGAGSVYALLHKVMSKLESRHERKIRQFPEGTPMVKQIVGNGKFYTMQRTYPDSEQG